MTICNLIAFRPFWMRSDKNGDLLTAFSDRLNERAVLFFVAFEPV